MLVLFSTPDAMRGRVNAVNMLFISSSNELGEFRAGSFAAWLGVVAAAVGGSLCTLAVVGAWMWGFKQLRTLDRFAEASSLPTGHAGDHGDGSAEERGALLSPAELTNRVDPTAPRGLPFQPRLRGAG